MKSSVYSVHLSTHNTLLLNIHYICLSISISPPLLISLHSSTYISAYLFLYRFFSLSSVSIIILDLSLFISFSFVLSHRPFTTISLYNSLKIYLLSLSIPLSSLFPLPPSSSTPLLFTNIQYV